MYILGLNAFHGDSSAALIHDGRLIAAAEEERFCRIKHWAGFPAQAIRYCLAEAGIDLGDVEHVAVNQSSRANLLGKIKYVIAQRPDIRLVLDRIANRRARADLPDLFSQHFGSGQLRARIHHVEHHLAHLCSAFLVSPFEDAAVVSIDGFGDFASAAWGVGHGTDIRVHGHVYFPHSLGVFYQAITQYLGFPHYGDEYKVMGLAPYGKPSRLKAMRKIVRLKANGAFELDLQYFRHHRERTGYQWTGGSPEFARLYAPALEDLLGPSRQSNDPLEDRHRDIARSAQAMYEEAAFHLISSLSEREKLPNLALAGGCAMNSVANGKIRQMTSFRDVFVQAAAGDAGGAIGAAYAVWHRRNRRRSFVMDHAYWGPQFGSDEIEDVLAAHRAKIDEAGCTIETIPDDATLCRRVAAEIANGKVIGWFQGRMEWGPRALGNRSILGDPRRPDMKDILNRKIKRRESFRPFAPSILRESVREWFEEDADVPFMMQVFRVRADKRAQIPAVTHVDGTGRLQTVHRDTNPLYHRLISEFSDLTGVPMVLNTSFNENEPVVCRPQEALDCFLRTNMDCLVLGNRMVRREDSV